jgi:hypothetical protein
MTTQVGSARCNFCGRIFKNKQAVKAHLKGCIAYREHFPRQRIPQAMPKRNTVFVQDFREQSEPERPWLHSRRGLIQQGKNHVIQNYSGFTRIPGEAQDQEFLELGLQTRDEQKRQEEEHRKEAPHEREQQRQQARQARIENGKRHAEIRLKDATGMGCWDRFLSMQEVEKSLCHEISGDESQSELEKIVDRILAPQMEEAECRADEEHNRKRRIELVKHGEAYARREMTSASLEDLYPLERLLIPYKVRQELEEELDGSESEDEVEDLVDDILEEALEEID